MTPDLLIRIVTLEVWGFALGLTGIVFHQLVSGRIDLRGLLRNKSPASGGELSPTRVQLLTLTLAAAFTYIALLPSTEPGTLPEIPLEIVVLFGGSASIYLGGKSTPLWKALLPDRESNE